ncbi:MAG: copper amine oxidase N-terminal domain-containing protein, partial [Defluviitaleaceae bacterium]|nr:copper amine oxidase N-terminal domain-containing protein [Defluviitaleaceae bacterium]MCL2841631.1 copper amine oxidase N-terminal domain-containing protein [Defluviitaleaceae bacterium]
ENALMLWSNPADGNVVSMLNPRIFADFIGGDIEWVEATQTVTFSGPDSNGSPVTVVLQVGSNTATINGVTHDIASFSGSGPANSVSTIISADRTFVPLRFLANAFLLPISFDHGTVVLG